MIFPFSSTSILSAAGFFGSPGIVMMEPVSATTKPAPAHTYASRTVRSNPSGRPSFFWSSDKEYWVFAMQTGRSPKPISVIFAIAFFAAGRRSPSQWSRSYRRFPSHPDITERNHSSFSPGCLLPSLRVQFRRLRLLPIPRTAQTHSLSPHRSSG